jgi:hypothetical protein
MRRRRNADAASSDIEVTEAPTLPSQAPENSTPPPDATVTPAQDSPAAETPKRRRPPARRKTAESPAEEAVPEPIVLAEPPVAESAPPPSPEGKPKRAPRRRSPNPAAAEGAIESPAASVLVPPSIAEADSIVPSLPAEATPTEKLRPSRRRGRKASAEAEDVAPPPETVTATTATDTAAEETAPAPPRRTRGLPRQRTGPSIVTAPTLLAPAAPAEAAEGAEGTEAPARKRTRGLRRTPRPTVVEAPPAAAPVELIRPVYQPLPAATLARLVETKVVVQKNVPELVVNGEPRLAVWFFVNTEDPDARDVAVRQIRLAYEAGVRFFTALAHLPWRTRAGERRYEPLDEALQLFADNAPEAFVLPRLIFSPPSSWVRTHEGDMVLHSNGEQGDVSIASRAFWEGEADEALRAAVEHVAEGPHAGRVFGFYLEHGEWFYEKGRDYDRSEANTQGFRDWLRARYRNNLVALRAAWYDGRVTFDTAAVPPYPPPAGLPAGATLFFGPREQWYVDFHEYASDIVAQVIIRLGKAVKEASGGRSAVAVSYGYTLELPRSASGHLALGQILDSANVDILTGPISYSARMPGGSAPLPVPIESIHLAGKLWVSEDDTKTFLSSDDTPDAYNPKVGSAEGTWAVHSRNFGAALACGAGISYMDLWGQGWLDDRAIWQNIRRLRDIAELVAVRRRDPRTRPLPEPDVAVFVDERSFFDVRSDESLLGHLISQQRDTLLRSGARIGFYLLSDLTKKDFPEKPKLFLFLNAFRIPEAVRTAIRERFQSDGRTLAWVYGPGAREESLAELTDTVGMLLKLQPWGSKTGTHVLSNARSPLTDALRGQKLGEETRYNPSFYIADPKAQVLGEYASTSNPSLGVRKHARWQSVFIGEMTLTLPLLRGLYRLAGVPVYTVDDDVAWIGDNLLTLHSAPGGGTTVYLPEEGVLADLLTGETLATNGYGARLSMPPRGTRLLFHGPAAEVARFGIDPKAGPPGLTEAELPLPFAPFAFEHPETTAVPLPDISAEDEALFIAALSGDLRPLNDEEEAATDEAHDLIGQRAEPGQKGTPTGLESAEADAADTADAGKKRRRRRRRGRGRGGAAEDAEGLPLNEGASDGTEEEEEGDSSEEIEVAPITATAPRARPSLEELLPLSEAPADRELPPIPEEFLPLDPLALTEENIGEADVPETRAPRRRRGRSRKVNAPDSLESGTEGEAPRTAETTASPATSVASGGSSDSE